MTEKEASKPSAQVQFKTHLEVGRGGHPPPPKCTFMSTRVSLSQIGGTCQGVGGANFPVPKIPQSGNAQFPD
eukprot:1148120-Pelagomonas_calceolata.AAC.3